MPVSPLKSHQLSIRGKKLDLTSPKIMGILNATPDSFSDGGRFLAVNKAIDRIGEMIEEGAAIIDIGGESTRPGSDPVSEQEELDRVLPILEKALQHFPEMIYSIDTTKFGVAKQALQCGAQILNDVSGFEKEPAFADLCSEMDASYILMHSKGEPKTMQKNPSYENVVEDLMMFFKVKLKILQEKGVENVIIDPGIGFGKTLNHNLKIIKELQKFTTLQKPILLGASRKSMIGRILNNRPAEGRVAGTIALHYQGLINGARILRVHDVQEAFDSIQIFNELMSV